MDLRIRLKVVDSNLFIKVFDVQSIWSAFGRTRPEHKSSFNFLDGIRVWSMSWVRFPDLFAFCVLTPMSLITRCSNR